jgi:hypothetical protein
MKLKTNTLIAFLGLLLMIIVLGMQGGCGEPISEEVSYSSPNWMVDGRIVASKTVVREKQKGIIPGYMTYEKIFEAEYIVTMKDDGTDEKVIYGGEDKYGKIGEIVASPLGNYIGFTDYKNGQYCVTIITADGTMEVKSIYLGERVNSFDWSPDETQIAYSGAESMGLYVLRVSDEAKAKIALPAYIVSWRNGDKIVYEGKTQIYSVNQHGTGSFEVVGSGAMPQKMGTNEVIYMDSTFRIHKINIDGTSDKVLFSDYKVASLKLSFDNTRITGGGGIWVVNIDGTNLRKLRD